MRVSDFQYELPEELIAQHPPAVRGSSRMLVVQRGRGSGAGAPDLQDDWFGNLASWLTPGDLLVLNDSRVLPGRLFAVRAGAATQAKSPRPSGRIEVLLTERVVAAETDGEVWKALVRPARKVQPGETLRFYAEGSDKAVLTAEVLAAGEFGERTLRFQPAGQQGQSFEEIVGAIGHMPLPPYIHRDQATGPDSAEDRTRYQTVYSREAGSAAAPTAGLHVTPETLAALSARGVEIAYLTLHVGLGTFQPVRVEAVAEIRLHAERYTLPAATAEALNRALHAGRRVIAVGTTTTRTLEHIGQTSVGAIQPHSGETAIFLAPGHRFRIVSGLLTNFHLPGSTLLMLVAALAAPAGDADAGRRKILAAYAHAVREKYRFYSYGDCMLIL